MRGSGSFKVISILIPPSNMPFQFDNRKVFLTYAQVGDTPLNDIFQFLSQLRVGRNPEQPRYLVVSRERHADGGFHFHAVIDFGKRFRSRDERVFDFNGLHPNIVAIRTDRQYKNNVDYTKKDGEFQELGEYQEPEERGHKQQHWIDLIDGSTNPGDFMAKAKAVAPRDFVLQNDKFEAFAHKYYNNVETFVPRYTPEDFTDVPDTATNWVEEVLNQVSSVG